MDLVVRVRPRGYLPVNPVFSYSVETVSLCPLVHTVHQIIPYQPVNVKRWKNDPRRKNTDSEDRQDIYRKHDATLITTLPKHRIKWWSPACYGFCHFSFAVLLNQQQDVGTILLWCIFLHAWHSHLKYYIHMCLQKKQNLILHTAVQLLSHVREEIR